MTTGEQTLAKLAAHKLKKAGANEWRCNSPLRSGSDSGAFSLHIDDDGEHGTWHDHVSGESGSLYQLAERLGIEVPKAQAQETKRAYQSLADYAAAHYAPVEAFTAAGWQEGTHKDRPCLIYKVGGKLRYRYLDGNPDKAAYEWEPGGKPAWYGLKHAPDMAKGRALVLCNGEASTISAQHHGVPACAWAGGEKKLPDHAITELKAAYTGPIIIAYDCDETGQRVAREVAEQLTGAGYDVRVADLGMTTHGDLADFCGLHTETAYAELDKRAVVVVPDPALVAKEAAALEAQVKAAQVDPQEALTKQAAKLEAQVERITAAIAPARVLELHELAELAAKPETRRWPSVVIPELAALIGPLKPELYVIYGATNMGKSWFASSAAAMLVKAGTGLIISTETNPEDFFRRMASYESHVPLIRMDDGLCSDIERTAWAKAAARFKGFNGRVLDMSSPTPKQVVNEAKRARKEIGLDWLVVDSATRMQGMGDSVYERMSSIANGLQNLARDLNVPVIMTSQIGRDVTDRAAGKRQPRLDDAYGSGAIEQNAGVVLGLYRHDYYVKKELEAPDDLAYPPDTARLILLKHRNRPIPDTPYCTVRYEAGCGFYQYKSQRVNLTALAEGKSA